MSDKVKKEIFNSVNENVQALAKLFPSVVKDGEVDFDALKEELGEFVEVGAEKYDFTWAGKSKAKAEARDSGEGLTLKLKMGEGVNEDTTQNIYIEGDNLKALKLLRNSYYGAIKMIYIDPPYNTGKDFVYRDNFTLSQEELDELGNNLDDEGNRLEKNSGDSARYHTDWLNMMYPRLKIARDLLSEDGVMFISIGEHEIENLKKICNDIFEENNYIETYIWESTFRPDNSSKVMRRNGEYVLCVAKNKHSITELLGEQKAKEGLPSLTKSSMKETILTFPANTVKTMLPDGEYKKGKRDSYELLDDVVVQSNIIIGKFRLKGRVIWSQENLLRELEAGTEIIIKGEGFVPYTKKAGDSIMAPTKLIPNNVVGDILAANAEMDQLFDKKVFSYPKPVSLLQYLIGYINDKDFTILDFFSGSSTTAQATFNINTDGGKRKFIMVQLPEDLDSNLKLSTDKEKIVIQNAIDLCDELNAGHYITEVAKERIRRAGKKIIEENPDKKDMFDIGFKVFEVAETNIRMFSEEMKGNDLFDLVKETDKELRDFMPETKDIDVCYELLLRHRGVALSSSIEKLDIGERTYIIADSIVVCLDSEVTEEMVEKLAVIDPQPMKYIFRDSAFGDDISLKENTMIMLSALIEKTTGDSKKAYKVEFI